MRTPLVLLLVLSLAACRFVGDPPHEARLEEEFEVPAADLEGLSCETHNGGIRVTGGGDDAVLVRAALRARGWSPEEAEANVRRIRLLREVEDGWLRLGWEDGEDTWDWNDSAPVVAFSIEAPARLEARVRTHNGEIEVRGLESGVAATTHNGRVVVAGAVSRLDVETHNGRVQAELSGSGPVEGSLGTHNGGVRVNMGGRSAHVTAHTHNGGIVVESGTVRARSDGGTLRATVGDGGGELSVVTHNGEVVVR